MFQGYFKIYKFITSFIIYFHLQPKTVNLDLSAKLLIGDANIDKTENAKFKSKYEVTQFQIWRSYCLLINKMCLILFPVTVNF